MSELQPSDMHRGFIRLAREATLRAKVAGEPPFGARAVSAAGEPMAVTADSLVAAHDFTQDADTNAVGDASPRRGPDLGGAHALCHLRALPMCFTAAWLARVSRLVISCIMAEVQEAARGRRRELTIPATEMARLARDSMLLVNGVLAADCLAPFQHQPR